MDALAERRDLVIDRLSSDYASGAFEVEELERRLALAHAATSTVELDAIVPPVTALVPAQQLRIVLGSIERTGPWTLPSRLATRVILGNLELDLRNATLAPGVSVIDVRVTLGNIEVIVPPGVAVEVAASTTLGNIEDHTERPPASASTVRIVGSVKLGSLEVSTRYRSERRTRRRYRRLTGCH